VPLTISFKETKKIMNKIVDKKILSNNVFQIDVSAPMIAQEKMPGQFIILQIHDSGERIPLTITDADTNAGTISLIFQVVGKTTKILASLNIGDSILNLVGPLGKPTDIKHYGQVILVGGGIGIAPLYPIAKAMKEASNTITIILGARTKELLILEDNMKEITQDIIICTDDGSYQRKSLVTEPLKEICEQRNPDLVVAIGPPLMMKFCSLTTKPFNIKTIVSLNTIMVDGTGMCGGCRVTYDGKSKFVCVDGPEFDGHLVDFDNMINRLNTYKQQERVAHNCKLNDYK